MEVFIHPDFNVINKIVESYYRKIENNPDEKESPIIPTGLHISIMYDKADLLFKSLVDLNDRKDIFYEYCIIKFILNVFMLNGKSFYEIHNTIMVRWVSIFNAVGAYKDCIICTDYIMNLPDWDILDPRNKLELLHMRAKAFRNLGDFEMSFINYRYALKIARIENMKADEGITLLKIGKVYSNYLLQNSLSLGFFEKAVDILTNISQYMPNDYISSKYLAICHDALGRVKSKRHINIHEAYNHFNEAIRLNDSIGRENGTIRVKSHLIVLKFEHSNDYHEQYKLIKDMEDIIEALEKDDTNFVGTGIRRVQLTHMYQKIGASGASKDILDCLNTAKTVATKFSDNKTMIRALLSEAELYTYYPENATQAIKFGKKLAKQFNLMLYESKINDVEIEFYKKLRDNEEFFKRTNRYNINLLSSLESPVTLFERNKMIYMELTSAVKRSLSIITQRKNDEFAGWENDEFSYLDDSSLKERVLYDYDDIISNLDQIIKNLTFELYKTESKKQELVGIAIMNSMARELLHTSKGMISLKDDGNKVHRIIEEIQNACTMLKNELSFTQSESLNEIYESLGSQINELNFLNERWETIRKFINRNIKAPRNFEQEVIVLDTCNKVTEEFEYLYPQHKGLLRIRKKCQDDIMIKSDPNVILNAISNLIKNAIDYIEKNKHSSVVLAEGIIIELDVKRIINEKYGNCSESAVISVMTTFENEEEAKKVQVSIQKGLSNYEPDNEFSSGFGLEYTKMIFNSLIKGKVVAEIVPVNKFFESGIRIELPTGVSVNVIGKVK